MLVVFVMTSAGGPGCEVRYLKVDDPFDMDLPIGAPRVITKFVITSKHALDPTIWLEIGW